MTGPDVERPLAIQSDVPLAPLCTLGVGGAARHDLVARETTHAASAVAWARRGSPSWRMPPLLGDSSPASSRSRVLLPQPRRPTRATNSPLAMCRSMPCSTLRGP